MIDKEKYNEELDEIIKSLLELRSNTKISDINLVTCLGGISLQLEDLANDMEYKIKNPL
jgi:hypothetical protein